MPNVKKKMEKLKHPNSRKTQKLATKMKRSERKDQNKLGTHIKQNVIGEKILWFKERIPEECLVLTKEQTLELIETYLSRFDEELEQIALKNSIGQRKNRQHASREDIINITRKREQDEFETCGLEMPDLLDAEQIIVAEKSWLAERESVSLDNDGQQNNSIERLDSDPFTFATINNVGCDDIFEPQKTNDQEPISPEQLTFGNLNNVGDDDIAEA